MSKRTISGRQHDALTIAELAVDPSDVDEPTYPVRIRLSRALTPHEAQALAAIAPGATVGTDSLTLADVRLDDVAHDIETWCARVENAEQLAGEASRSADDAQHRLTEQHRDLTRDSSVEHYMH